MASDTGKTTRGGKAAGKGKPDAAPENDARTQGDWTREPGDAPAERRDLDDELPQEVVPVGTEATTGPAPDDDPSENMFADARERDEVSEVPADADASAGVAIEPTVERVDRIADDPATTPRDDVAAEAAEAASGAEYRAADPAAAWAAEDAARQDEPVVRDDPDPEPAATEPTQREQPVTPPPPPPPTQRSGGFLPALLGGVLAAAIGYAVAIYGWSADLNLPFLPDRDGGAEVALNEARAEFAAASEAQAAQLAALQEELAALRDAPAQADTAGIAARLDDLAAGLAAVEAQLAEPAAAADDGAIAELQDRIAELENRPAGEATASAESEELIALRESLAALQDEVAQLSAQTAEAAAAAEAAAQAAESELADRAAEAEAAAQGASARAALAELVAALDTGAPLAPALESVDAAGLDAPQPLLEARDGVPTLAALQSAYPDAARAALADAHAAEDPADPVDRLGSFLRAQVQLRSLSPRAGEDADAILSRAEAALRAGDLDTAVAEVETLPEPAQPAMAGWLNDARARLAAVQAAESLAAEIDPQ